MGNGRADWHAITNSTFINHFVPAAQEEIMNTEQEIQIATLGCVNPASWLCLAAGGEFTQPRDHSFAQPCSWGAKATGSTSRRRPPMVQLAASGGEQLDY